MTTDGKTAAAVADEEAHVDGLLGRVRGIEFLAAQRARFGPDGGDIGPGDDFFADAVARDGLRLEGDALGHLAAGDAHTKLTL